MTRTDWKPKPIRDVRIERVELTGHGAQGFGRWLEGWKDLRRRGYEVAVVVALDRTHAVGLAFRPPFHPRKVLHKGRFF